MHLESRELGGRARLVAGALLSLFILGFAGTARGAEDLVPFDGEKSSWHGFDRYDFLMDETDLTIKPYKVAPDEGNAVKAQVKGQRRCVVVVPKTAASGNPWSWQGCYWDHEPQAEVELLKRGFHIAFAAPDAGAQGKVWDAWYKFLTEKHGLAKKAAFIGMSKGGVNEFNWGVVNPDKVACIYADNPALYDEDFAKLPELAKHDVPLLHVCGSEDFLLQRHTRAVEDTYHQLGGLITVIVKEGHAHHPHSLQNPKLIADWIEQHMTPSTANRPAFVDATFTKGYYYSLEPCFIYLKEEDTYATARGPGFTECYDRYDGGTSGAFRTGGISIIVPKTVAPGKPWVFTGDPLERDATVEQALLAKGYHILILSPLGSGMTRKQWDDAYKLLVDNGFSNKPVLKGTGAMAGEAYAWAVANPDKVSCIYARNPLMKSLMAGKEQPIDNLAALAKAGVPVLHDCGALDPWLDNQTRVVEKRYKELDGKITVIVREGEGHFPLSPKDPKSVVDFILSRQETKGMEPKTTPPEGSQAGVGQYWQVDYPESTVEGELKIAVTYTLWIPDGVKQLRGVIVHQHGAGTTASKEGSTAAYDLHWQALAKKWDCALLGPSYHVSNEKTDLTPGGSELWFDPRRGSEKTFLKALGELAAKSGHAELETVPWALWGHSGGGIWADVLSTLHPDRVVAVWLRSGSAAMFRTRSEFPQPEIPAAVYAIPIMANPGVKEKSDKIPDVKGKEQGVWWGNLATFREYRAEGAPIGFAPDPRTGHECGDSRYLAIPFFDACLAMRLPDKGGKDQTLKPVDMSKAWLAPVLGDTAQPAAEFKGNAKDAVWLPNEAVAKAWMEYVKTGAVSDTTPPPAPFNVQATAKADQGTEIVWNAEADFESGIGGFIVLRDGQELAKAPKTPVGKFGRPLFQSMTYHDTPDQPLAQMRYVDASSKPGEKHTYTIVAVNSVGLKSEPSASSAPPKAPPPQTPPAQAIPVKGDAPISLYGGGAASTDDCVKKQADLFVSPAGNDGGSGARATPFATLQKARDAARGMPKPVTIHLAGGTYYLPETLVLGPEDSGVTWQANEGETPIVSGGVKLDLKWTTYKEGILQTKVPEDLVTEELFVNGERQVLARYPNFDPEAKYFNGYAADVISKERAARWADPAGGYFHAMHPAMWGGFTWRITGKDAKGEITKEGGWQNNRGGAAHPEIRFVENIFEELDAPGEWFLNRKTHTLYFYPPAGLDLSNATVEVTRLATLIELRGAQEKPVQSVVLRGITFRHANRTVMETKEPLLRTDWAIYRGGAVFLQGAEDCLLEDLLLDQVGGNAIFVNHYNRRVTVRGCEIVKAGASGVVFVGDPKAARNPLFNYDQRQKAADLDRTLGPKTDEYPADCLVEDCLIHLTGRVEKQTAGVNIDLAQNITVRHCSIYDMPRAGINIGDGCWGGHVVEWCDVFDTVKETGDHGSFNSWGRDRWWGLKDVGMNDLLSKEDTKDLPLLDCVKQNILRNNRWRCDHGWDIDLDDGSSNYWIYNNLCLNGGIKNREGYLRIDENNVTVNNGFHAHVWLHGCQDIVRRNIFWRAYEMSPGVGKEVDNNLVQVSGLAAPRPAEGLQKGSRMDTHSVEADAMFIDPAHGDYRVKPDSPALALGFKNFPMDQFGVTSPRLKAKARSPILPGAAAVPEKNAIPVKSDASTSLYGGGAASTDDCVKKQAGDSFRWTGSGQITWKVQVDRAGDYEVALCHAAEPGAVGQHLQVSSGDSRVGYTLAMTKGVFGDKSYEMTPIKDRLHLEAGTQSITLSIPDAPKATVALAFRSLELVPVAANEAIEDERQEARRARASTEWLAKAGYGLMFHWTSQSVGKDGTHKPYAQAVDDFDVKRFADMVDETGAGYVILTIGHAESYCPAPLKAWEKYHPGKTTRRDLIAEMADALNAKGIKLMCYLNAASLGKYPKADEEEFSRIMTEVLTEFGERYKEKVAGYWIDCCYQAKEKYPGFSFREFFKACKAGNPDRLLALNSWIYPNVSEWQEYWAGETASPVGLPVDGTTQEDGPGAGLRYHALLIMEPYWVQEKVEMPKPRFTAEQLGDTISQCKAKGGAVTINLGIYQDGTVDPNAVTVLKEVRKRVR